MCLISSCEKADNITIHDIALYGGPNNIKFKGDYIKYIEALYPDDLDKQDKHLIKSKDYYIYLEKNLPREINDLNLISGYITSKVNFIINSIK